MDRDIGDTGVKKSRMRYRGTSARITRIEGKLEITTDWPTDRQTDKRVIGKFLSLPIKIFVSKNITLEVQRCFEKWSFVDKEIEIEMHE